VDFQKDGVTAENYGQTFTADAPPRIEIAGQPTIPVGKQADRASRL
jgi:hypothetical protein